MFTPPSTKVLCSIAGIETESSSQASDSSSAPSQSKTNRVAQKTFKDMIVAGLTSLKDKFVTGLINAKNLFVAVATTNLDNLGEQMASAEVKKNEQVASGEVKKNEGLDEKTTSYDTIAQIKQNLSQSSLKPLENQERAESFIYKPIIKQRKDPNFVKDQFVLDTIRSSISRPNYFFNNELIVSSEFNNYGLLSADYITHEELIKEYKKRLSPEILDRYKQLIILKNDLDNNITELSSEIKEENNIINFIALNEKLEELTINLANVKKEIDLIFDPIKYTVENCKRIKKELDTYPNTLYQQRINTINKSLEPIKSSLSDDAILEITTFLLNRQTQSGANFPSDILTGTLRANINDPNLSKAKDSLIFIPKDNIDFTVKILKNEKNEISIDVIFNYQECPINYLGEKIGDGNCKFSYTFKYSPNKEKTNTSFTCWDFSYKVEDIKISTVTTPDELRRHLGETGKDIPDATLSKPIEIMQKLKAIDNPNEYLKKRAEELQKNNPEVNALDVSRLKDGLSAQRKSAIVQFEDDLERQAINTPIFHYGENFTQLTKSSLPNDFEIMRKKYFNGELINKENLTRLKELNINAQDLNLKIWLILNPPDRAKLSDDEKLNLLTEEQKEELKTLKEELKTIENEISELKEIQYFKQIVKSRTEDIETVLKNLRNDITDNKEIKELLLNTQNHTIKHFIFQRLEMLFNDTYGKNHYNTSTPLVILGVPEGIQEFDIFIEIENDTVIIKSVYNFSNVPLNWTDKTYTVIKNSPIAYNDFSSTVIIKYDISKSELSDVDILFDFKNIKTVI